MVAPTELAQRIDAELNGIEAELEFLPELVELWKEEPKDQQVVWVYEWCDLLSRLRFINRQSTSVELSESQDTRIALINNSVRKSRTLFLTIGIDISSYGIT